MVPLTRKIAFIVAFLSIFTNTLALADNQSSQERIEHFSSDISISSDSIATVKENIKYFFPEAKHGIIRDIPIQYSISKNGKTQNVSIKFKLLGVNIQKDDGTITSVPYTESKNGNSEEIKIGDPKTTVTGFQDYVINYQVSRVINFSPEGNPDQDEFYWNVTGTEWSVPITSAEASVTFPTKIDPEKWKFACYVGTLGSTSQECSIEASSENTTHFEAKWNLGANEGLTIVSGIPKGILTPTKENPVSNFWENVLPYLSLLLPLFVFIGLFINWFLRGRDPEGKGTIIPYYSSPDELTPTEIGTLYDEKADLKDISASIIDFAVKGFIKIREVENKGVFGFFKGKSDYELILLRRDGLLVEPEKEIFEIIFPRDLNEFKSERSIGNDMMDLMAEGKAKIYNDRIRLSELQDRFPQRINDIKTDIYDGLVKKGYFPKSPQRIRNAYLFVGLILAFLGFILMVNSASILVGGSIIITGIMVAIFGFFMPKKTVKGVDAYEKILGLKEYLTVAEKDRIQFHNAPAKRPETFEKLLPYAMVLGVEKEWAMQFQNIYLSPPGWYEGAPGSSFNTFLLISSLNNFSSVANASMGIKTEGSAAAGGMSGFGGGGFSGGGFGGGGGGSW